MTLYGSKTGWCEEMLPWICMRKPMNGTEAWLSAENAKPSSFLSRTRSRPSRKPVALLADAVPERAERGVASEGRKRDPTPTARPVHNRTGNASFYGAVHAYILYVPLRPERGVRL